MPTLEQLLSGREIRDAIGEIIAGEDRTNPYSDIALTMALKDRGLDVALHLTKYHRSQLLIPGAPTRRHNYAASKNKGKRK